MEYCKTHQRAKMPAGWDVRKRKMMDSYWYAPGEYVLAWAGIVQRKFPNSIQITHTNCDLCEVQELG